MRSEHEGKPRMQTHAPTTVSQAGRPPSGGVRLAVGRYRTATVAGEVLPVVAEGVKEVEMQA